MIVPVDEPIIPEPTEPMPNDIELMEYVFDGIALATDGCTVEPDGYCPHGYPSWLLQLGII